MSLSLDGKTKQQVIRMLFLQLQIHISSIRDITKIKVVLINYFVNYFALCRLNSFLITFYQQIIKFKAILKYTH